MQWHSETKFSLLKVKMKATDLLKNRTLWRSRIRYREVEAAGAR